MPSTSLNCEINLPDLRQYVGSLCGRPDMKCACVCVCVCLYVCVCEGEDRKGEFMSSRSVVSDSL